MALRIFWHALRIAFGLMWIAAAAPKLQDPLQFTMEVRAYRMVADPVPALVALWLPPLELLMGVLIIVGRWGALASLWMSQLLLLGFTVLLASAWARGLDISCGCFADGGDEKADFGLLVLRDIAFLIWGGLLIWRARLIARRGDSA